MAPSGQEFMCGPLSVPYMTNVLSARCVRKCIAVELYQRKNGWSALACFSIQAMARSVISSSIVSIRLMVRGPVSVTFWPPLPSEMQCRTPRGPNFFLKAGSLG